MPARAMSLATATLPTDPEMLRAFAARLQAELYAKTHPWPPIGRGPTRGEHIEKLKAELALLQRARYGRSSERIEQLELLIGELEADEAEHEAKAPAAAPDKPRSTSSPPRGRQPRGPHAACWPIPSRLAGSGTPGRGVAAAGASAAPAGRARGGLHLPGLRQHSPEPDRHG